MPVITIGNSSTVPVAWGLDNETGMLIQSCTIKSSREKNIVKDPNGDICAIAFYNQTQTISASGVVNAAGGVMLVGPGTSLVLVNANNNGAGQNGSSSGLVYCDDVEISKSNSEFMKISLSGTRYLAIS